jgi:hypothetical protein
VLDQLVSEAGIDHRITRKYFRAAIEQGCGICVSFYIQFVPGFSGWKSEIPEFWVLDNRDPNLDDQELVINWSVKLVPDKGPYDIQELVLDAFSGKQRGSVYTRYYVNADPGNTLSFGLLPLQSCSDESLTFVSKRILLPIM